MRGIWCNSTILALATALVGAAPALALTVTVSPIINHPATQIGVTGSGFSANEAIDIYFDTTDELLVFSDSTGNIVRHTFYVPTTAAPGQHWVSAVGRKNGDGGQVAVTINTDWTTFGFKPSGKRNNVWENVLSASNIGQLDIAWSRTLNGFGGITSSPAVANGIAFIGSPSGTLYAFNSVTGTPLWTATTGTSIVSSPAVSGGIVYVGSQDKTLYAFAAANGDEVDIHDWWPGRLISGRRKRNSVFRIRG